MSTILKVSHEIKNFSLTLNKLRQKRMIEEKIAQRQAQQMEELQQKQNAEIMVCH